MTLLFLMGLLEPSGPPAPVYYTTADSIDALDVDMSCDAID